MAAADDLPLRWGGLGPRSPPRTRAAPGGADGRSRRLLPRAGRRSPLIGVGFRTLVVIAVSAAAVAAICRSSALGQACADLAFAARAVGKCKSEPWKVAAWNQHRKSSYLQKDCVWISKLVDAGYIRNDINTAIEEVGVEYSPKEMQDWVNSYDVALVQEFDPLLRDALGEKLCRNLICGANDFDGRGIEVESSTGMLLNPESGLESIGVEHAKLAFRTTNFRGVSIRVSRELVVVRVRRASDGQEAVFCSLHLHPPGQVEASGGSYLRYLEPLERAVLAAAGATPPGAEAGEEAEVCFPVPCFLAGDFNMDPVDFRERTCESAFWRAFELREPGGEKTAHRSNPATRGDFAASAGPSGPGTWTSSALGPEDFGPFESYAADVTRAAEGLIQLKLGQVKLEVGLRALERSVLDVQDLCSEDALASANRAAMREALEACRKSVASAVRCLKRETRIKKAKRQRKGIHTSDHRPLHFEGSLGGPSTATAETLMEPRQQFQDVML
mmetsp:Transcript_7323/g.26616  ORF Transcript_7323/g.26616 Transcript_7323/m.26616 type:complete len:502 (-) Transcript_7323:219-1724(-)|eukprot:CAMPEP_0203901860 /NCGR_PEP_ID=MMETSP0359-20131031/43950_1 /ASSEMBLY_ACC=CAM_ASM_000338 /TAXON_ID=268821 /ORGANISM="Scrippsiella Hangoei, Strain SHTV-5" /LENGTH=501 /DNA_ID=CAMNT_0050825577 /DNA_START=122 /DNA_END=1627 /DNA_ORIENTATION=+